MVLSVYFSPKFQLVQDVHAEYTDYKATQDYYKKSAIIHAKNVNWAYIIAIGIGIGEGFLAGASVFNYFKHGLAIIPLVALTAFVFLCGYWCNYKLTKGDTIKVLDKLFKKELFVDKNGKPISGWQKIGVIFLFAGLGFDCSGNRLWFIARR